MYLHLLEKDEKSTFLSFARHFAAVDDDKIDAQERYVIRYMCAEMGLDPEEDSPTFDEEALLKVFHRPVAQRVLVLEGLGIGYANGDLNARQRSLMNRLVAKFTLPDDFVGRCEQAVRRQLDVMAEFDSLVNS